MKKSRASTRRFSEFWEHCLICAVAICVAGITFIYASSTHQVTPFLLQFQKPKVKHEYIMLNHGVPRYDSFGDVRSERFESALRELLPAPEEYWFHPRYEKTNNVIIWGVDLEYPTNALLGQSITVKATPYVFAPKTPEAEATLWKALSTGKVILRFNLSSAVVKPDTISIITKDNPARWSVTPRSEDMQKGAVSVEYLNPNGALNLRAGENVNIYVYRPVLTKWNIIKFSGFSILTLASIFGLIRLAAFLVARIIA